MNGNDIAGYLSSYTDQYWSKVVTAYGFGQTEYLQGLPKVKSIFNSISGYVQQGQMDQLTNLINNSCLYVICTAFTTRNVQPPAECVTAFNLINNMVTKINQQTMQTQMMQSQQHQNVVNGNMFANPTVNIAGQMGGFANPVAGGALHDTLPTNFTGATPVNQTAFVPAQAQAGISATSNVTQNVPAVVVDRSTPLLVDGVATFGYSQELSSQALIEERMNSDEMIDSIGEILEKFKSDLPSKVWLVTTFESIVIYPTEPERLDDLIKMLTSLSNYTSLYQWLLEVTNFKDSSVINFINNRLNQIINVEVENRTGEKFPFQQIFYRWDNFMELVRSMKIEWVTNILLDEVLSYSNNIKILGMNDKDATKTALLITRPVPTLIFNSYLTFLHKKGELITNGFSEESFYILYHRVFSDLQKKYKLSHIKMVDRSMLKFQLNELQQHLLTPAKNYSVKMLDSTW
jgi:hypothetical protein